MLRAGREVEEAARPTIRPAGPADADLRVAEAVAAVAVLEALLEVGEARAAIAAARPAEAEALVAHARAAVAVLRAGRALRPAGATVGATIESAVPAAAVSSATTIGAAAVSPAAVSPSSVRALHAHAFVRADVAAAIAAEKAALALRLAAGEGDTVAHLAALAAGTGCADLAADTAAGLGLAAVADALRVPAARAAAVTADEGHARPALAHLGRGAAHAGAAARATRALELADGTASFGGAAAVTVVRTAVRLDGTARGHGECGRTGEGEHEDEGEAHGGLGGGR